MADTETFTTGSDVACSDGKVGQVRRAVLDPVARAVTHLAVEPRHGAGVGAAGPMGE